MVRYSALELEQWSGGSWSGVPPTGVRAVAHDSRKLAPGDLYAAIRGAQFDGHAFVAESLAQGACGALVAADWTPPQGLAGPFLRVADTRAALRDLARGYRRRLNPHVIGITGSAGKTSVKEMTACLLREVYSTAATLGNWNNDLGLPLSLLAMPVEATHAVIEAGTNHPGEIADLCRIFEPDWGVVTNVGPVHIAYFDSVEAIAREKSELLAALPADGMAVLHREGPYVETLRAATRAPVVMVSLNPGADYVITARAGKAHLVERTTQESCSFRLPGPGEHQLLNAAMAVVVARRAGLDWASIQNAFEHYAPPPMRWQRLHVAGVLFINDAYNANPISMSAALSAFAQVPAEGRKWLVLGDMLELGRLSESEHDRLGVAVAAGPWEGLLAVGAFGDYILAGARRAGLPGDKALRCVDSQGVVQALLARVQPGDAVLLKASRGMHLETVVTMFEQARSGRQA